MAGTRTALFQASDNSNATVYTFASQSLGAADAGRYILICVQTRKATGSSLNTISSVTIAGVSATLVLQVANTLDNANIAAMFIALVPTGTTGDIVVTCAETNARMGIQGYRLIGIDGLTPSDALSDVAHPPTGTIDCPADGLVIGCAVHHRGGTVWTGLTEDYDQDVEAQITATSASAEFASAQTGLTVTSTMVSTNSWDAMVVASWGPAASNVWFSRLSRGSKLLQGKI